VGDSGSSGFFIALIALQVVYFFFWFKNALWSWLLFWIYNKRQMAKFVENYLIDNHFPVPDEYTTDLNDYLTDIANNEELNCATRIKAAAETPPL
jgi:hypothetical protein